MKPPPLPCSAQKLVAVQTAGSLQVCGESGCADGGWIAGVCALVNRPFLPLSHLLYNLELGGEACKEALGGMKTLVRQFEDS